MSVVEFGSGDLFIARVFKNHIANPDNTWVNSYEFKSTEAGTVGVIIDLAEKLVNFEIAVHSVAVNFTRITISTWEIDSVPYDPTTFFSTTTTGVGTRSTTGDLVGLNNCLTVSRVPISGRFGHIFYRGFLVESDIEAPAGKTVLADKPGTQTIVDAALTSSGLDETIGIAADGSFQMVMVDKTGIVVRNVRELLVSGVSALPQDHAWFNRTAP